MRKNLLFFGLLMVFMVTGARAQETGAANPTVTEGDAYCSGIISTAPVSRAVQIVSGEDANARVSFAAGDYVYINKGSNENIKPGDLFSVVRPVEYHGGVEWFTSQLRLMHAMGQAWEDEGRLKIVVVHPKLSIAIITDACNFMERGDVVIPFVKRPVPQLKSEDNFDRFAPPSGKPKAMVVMAKGFGINGGTNDIVYVNLGSAHGVKIGDYFRFFRYQGNNQETAYQTPNVATVIYGFGSAPNHYTPRDLPRQVLGEGVVLRTGPHSATVLITYSEQPIYDGDYCELE